MDMPVLKEGNNTYTSSEHPLSLFSRLIALRNELCDVTLQAGTTKLHAHKIILAASSPYFKAMFTGNMLERDMSVINLKGVSDIGLSAVLGFIYTSEIKLSCETIEDVLEASTYLQVTDLTEICCKFLIKLIDFNTYQMVFETSVTHGFKECAACAISFASVNFTTIMKKRCYLALSADGLAAVLNQHQIPKCSELELLNCIIDWLKNKGLEFEYETVLKLIKGIRLHCIPQKEYDIDFKPLLQQMSGRSERCPWNYIMAQVTNYHEKIHEQPIIASKLPGIRNASDKLIVIGGKRLSFKSVYSDEICMKNANESFWNHLVLYPDKGISHAGVAVMQNFLYIVGGQCDGEAVNTVHRYDPSCSRWCANLAPLHTPREYFHLSAINGKLYAIAGRNAWRQCLPTCESYDPLTNKWTPISSIEVSLACHAGTSTNDTIWISGGVSNGGVYQNHLLAYDTLTDTWETKKPAGIRRVWHCMEAVRNKLFIFGGNKCNTSMDRVPCMITEVYNIKTAQWSVVQPILLGVIEASSAVWNNKIYLVGGYSHLRENAVPNVQVYSFETNQWEECIGLLNEQVRGPSCCVLKISDSVAYDQVTNG